MVGLKSRNDSDDDMDWHQLKANPVLLREQRILQIVKALHSMIGSDTRLTCLLCKRLPSVEKIIIRDAVEGVKIVSPSLLPCRPSKSNRQLQLLVKKMPPFKHVDVSRVDTPRLRISWCLDGVYCKHYHDNAVLHNCHFSSHGSHQSVVYN